MQIDLFTMKIGGLPALAGVLLFAFPLWCGAGIDWEGVWDVKVNGQRFSIQTFTSRMTPDTAARKLAESNAAYQRYLVADGRILLSGVVPGAHWLAEISGHPDGAQGYISALYFDHEGRAPSAGVVAASEPHAFHAEAGSLAAPPRRVFEFGPSTAVELMTLPAAPSFAPSVTRGLLEDAVDTSVLIRPDGHPDTAVAVFMREH